ncbi:MAG: preprotein translocase subunit Sec61beta [Candidatus Nezhaarchaeota archaeon]|nr:preprotein translocase subunit Sec61beta [Candidatus Nezhaarchaeota archaeon]
MNLMSKKAKAKAKSTKGSRPRREGVEFTPITGAGLIRFFKEETGGLSIPPYVVVVIATVLIIIVLALPILLPL